MSNRWVVKKFKGKKKVYYCETLDVSSFELNVKQIVAGEQMGFLISPGVNKPIEVWLNDNNIAHREDGASIIFKDREYWFWNGVQVFRGLRDD